MEALPALAACQDGNCQGREARTGHGPLCPHPSQLCSSLHTCFSQMARTALLVGKLGAAAVRTKLSAQERLLKVFSKLAAMVVNRSTGLPHQLAIAAAPSFPRHHSEEEMRAAMAVRLSPAPLAATSCGTVSIGAGIPINGSAQHSPIRAAPDPRGSVLACTSVPSSPAQPQPGSGGAPLQHLLRVYRAAAWAQGAPRSPKRSPQESPS